MQTGDVPEPGWAAGSRGAVHAVNAPRVCRRATVPESLASLASLASRVDLSWVLPLKGFARARLIGAAVAACALAGPGPSAEVTMGFTQTVLRERVFDDQMGQAVSNTSAALLAFATFEVASILFHLLRLLGATGVVLAALASIWSTFPEPFIFGPVPSIRDDTSAFLSTTPASLSTLFVIDQSLASACAPHLWSAWESLFHATSALLRLALSPLSSILWSLCGRRSPHRRCQPRRVRSRRSKHGRPMRAPCAPRRGSRIWEVSVYLGNLGMSIIHRNAALLSPSSTQSESQQADAHSRWGRESTSAPAAKAESVAHVGRGAPFAGSAALGPPWRHSRRSGAGQVGASVQEGVRRGRPWMAPPGVAWGRAGAGVSGGMGVP